MYARREQVLALLLLKSMVDLHKLPVRDKKGDVYVVVETPRGSAAKLEFDPDLQLFTLSKSLILGCPIPTIGVLFHPPRVKTAIPSTR
jgi:hypothetical protein